MKRAIGILVLLTGLLGLALAWKLQEQRKAQLGPLRSSGTVEGTEVSVMAKVPGRVVYLGAEEGDRVHGGQILVRLDCKDQKALLARAQAQLEVARAAAKAAEVAARAAAKKIGLATASLLSARAQKEAAAVQSKLAERTAQRVSKLKRAGAVPDTAYDKATSSAKAMEYRIQAMEAAVRAAKYQKSAARAAYRAALEQFKVAAKKVAVAEAAVRQAQVAVDECTIRAPRAGYVQVRAVELGEVVLPGSKLFEIVDITKVRIRFYVPNRELGAVRPGGSVWVQPDAYPKLRLKGRILRVHPEAEFTPRNVQTRSDRDRLVYAVDAEVDNPAGKLRPGMPVEIILAERVK